MRRALLLLALASCTAVVHHGPTFEPITGFTACERNEIIAARDKWAEIAKPEKLPLFVAGGRWRIQAEAFHNGYAGWTSAGEKVIYLTPEALLDGGSFYAMALHEFGHVLGLLHGKRGVMEPHSGATEFSDEDIAMCHSVGACP